MNSYSAFRKSIDRIRGVSHTLDTRVSIDRLKTKKADSPFSSFFERRNFSCFINVIQKCTREIQKRFDTRKVFGYKDSCWARSTISSDTMNYLAINTAERRNIVIDKLFSV